MLPWLALLILCAHHAAGLHITQKEVSELPFPFAPGFDATREGYVVGAYALLSQGVLRVVAMQSNQIEASSLDKSKLRLTEVDQRPGKRVWCVFGTEEATPANSTFRCSAHLVLLDCPLPPRAAVALADGAAEAHVALVAADEAADKWEPLIKARILGDRPSRSGQHATPEKRSVRLCTTALSSGMQPYLLEWVDWYLLLGVDHIVVYLSDMSPALPELLRPYVERGSVELRLWQLPELLPRVLMSQQIALIQDCLYRSKGAFEWVLSVDLDEYLFLGKHKALKALLREYEAEDDVVSLLLRSWPHVPKADPWKDGTEAREAWAIRKSESNGTDLGEDLEMLTFKHFNHRTREPHPFSSRTKAILRTSHVQSAETHFVTSGGRTVHVGEDVAHLKHYWNMYNDRALDAGLSKGSDDYHADASAYTKFGHGFMARWPYSF